MVAEAPGQLKISGMADGTRADEGTNNQGSVDVHTFADEMDHTFSRPSSRRSPGGSPPCPSGLDFQQLKFKRLKGSNSEKRSRGSAAREARLTLMLKPSRSLTTAETADRITTLVKL